MKHLEQPNNNTNKYNTTQTADHTKALHNSSFLIPNGFHTCCSSNIEMIAIQSVSYTSLKDLLPTSPPPPLMSPMNNSSWYELPIKNPLVKHAALAYLQPMATPVGTGNKGFLERFKDKFFKCCGCFEWLNGVVLRSFRDSFLVYSSQSSDDDEEEEEEEGDAENVD